MSAANMPARVGTVWKEMDGLDHSIYLVQQAHQAVRDAKYAENRVRQARLQAEANLVQAKALLAFMEAKLQEILAKRGKTEMEN